MDCHSFIPIAPYMHERRIHDLPPIDWLAQRFTYCPDTGEIKSAVTGKTAKHVSKDGYVKVFFVFNGKKIQVAAHRLAYALTAGEWPHLVNHIDGDRANNAWANLENTTASANARHREASRRFAVLSKRKAFSARDPLDEIAKLRASIAEARARTAKAQNAMAEIYAERDQWRNLCRSLAGASPVSP